MILYMSRGHSCIRPSMCLPFEAGALDPRADLVMVDLGAGRGAWQSRYVDFREATREDLRRHEPFSKAPRDAESNAPVQRVRALDSGLVPPHPAGSAHAGGDRR